MDGPIVIRSTTDSEEEMRASMGLPPKKETPASAAALPVETSPETPAAEPTPSAVVPSEKPAEGEPGKVAAKPDEKPEKPAEEGEPARFQRRIDQLTAKLRNAERDGQESRSELQRMRDRIAALETAKAEAGKAPEAPQEIPKPKQEDFETHEAWVEALTDWKVEQRFAGSAKTVDEQVEAKLKGERARQQTEARQRAEAASQQAFQGRQQAVAEKYADYDAAIAAADEAGIEVTPWVDDTIRRAPFGAELMYQLVAEVRDALRDGKPVEQTVAHRLAYSGPRFDADGNVVALHGGPLPPAQSYVEIGRLMGRTGLGGSEPAKAADAPAGEEPAAPAAAPRPRPVAPTVRVKPPTPVGAGATAPKVDLENADYATFKKLRDEQERQRMAHR